MDNLIFKKIPLLIYMLILVYYFEFVMTTQNILIALWTFIILGIFSYQHIPYFKKYDFEYAFDNGGFAMMISFAIFSIYDPQFYHHSLNSVSASLGL